MLSENLLSPQLVCVEIRPSPSQDSGALYFNNKQWHQSMPVLRESRCLALFFVLPLPHRPDDPAPLPAPQAYISNSIRKLMLKQETL